MLIGYVEFYVSLAQDASTWKAYDFLTTAIDPNDESVKLAYAPWDFTIDLPRW